MVTLTPQRSTSVGLKFNCRGGTEVIPALHLLRWKWVLEPQGDRTVLKYCEPWVILDLAWIQAEDLCKGLQIPLPVVLAIIISDIRRLEGCCFVAFFPCCLQASHVDERCPRLVTCMAVAPEVMAKSGIWVDVPLLSTLQNGLLGKGSQCTQAASRNKNCGQGYAWQLVRHARSPFICLGDFYSAFPESCYRQLMAKW